MRKKITHLEQKRTGWIEPMRKRIKKAENLPKIAREGNLFAKKAAAKEIFGSNFILANREARVSAPSDPEFKPKIQWAARRAAHEMASEKSKSFILARDEGIEPPPTVLETVVLPLY